MRLRQFLPLLAIVATACGNVDMPRTVENFNYDWKFSLQADSLSVTNDLDDAQWRTVDLPHDWSIEGSFDEKHPCTAGGGALPGGYGVYRKHFSLPQNADNKRVFVCFDGVYWQSTVYINGKKVGFRPNGYISFEYDITDFVNFGDDNLIAVTVDNSNQPNSRWYSGSGIYRNVYIKTLNAEHFVENETFVTTPSITAETAQVNVKAKISTNGNFSVKCIIKNPEGSVVANGETNVDADGFVNFDNLKVKSPQLWEISNPNIYSVELSLYQDGKIKDTYSTTFGIRSFSFDSDNGFVLNGKTLKINGVCNHHDLGALGSALNHRALQRQLEILKQMGCNAIRTSHNPPAVELLNLCDSMGFVVMDEAFDMWARKKSPNDYAQYFPQWHERDLSDFIKRDRNHPSVIMWSVGNEILEQWGDISTDTLSIEKANLMFNFAGQLSKQEDNNNDIHVNSLLCKKLVDIVKALDPTRPVTAGNNETEPHNYLFKAKALDIIGFNYHEYNWGEAFREKYPNMPLIITESTSALQTRGHYIAPADTQYLWPVRWDLPFETDDHKCSAYDNVRAPWGTTHETTLRDYMKYPWCSGIFVWTGFDYLGEPTPYGWPSRSSYFGIVDLAGFPKDVYYLYKSLWTNDDVLHILPHWNWQSGDTIDVWAYTNLKEVELFLNGESMGKKSFGGDKLHLSWRVAYQPGELKAVGVNANGDEITEIVRTASQPKKIVATPDRSRIAADGCDLSFIAIDIADEDGNIVPDACNKLKFTISGPATIVGLDNGDQVSHESFKGNEHSAFNGKCLCIVKSKRGECGFAKISILADGLEQGDVSIEVRN